MIPFAQPRQKARSPYSRAADYVSVASIFLQDNLLLTEPLRPEHVKPRLLGHWGTCPGITTVYEALNTLVRERGADVLLVTGPGHGAPALGATAAIEEFLARAPSVTACGHRLVHGGPDVRLPTPVDSAVRSSLEAAAGLAPLHVPPALAALGAARRILPDLPHVLCPDTAFHHGLPEPAPTDALPKELTRRHGLRRYGFHGLSYAYTLRRAAELLGRPDVREAVAAGLGVLGVRGGLRRDNPGGPAVIRPPGARVPVLVVPTGEIPQIARETRTCVSGDS